MDKNFFKQVFCRTEVISTHSFFKEMVMKPSKHQTSRQRCPARPRPCTVFRLSLTHYELPKRFYRLVPQYGVNNCVLCTIKAKKANKNILQRNLSGVITISPCTTGLLWLSDTEKNQDNSIYQTRPVIAMRGFSQSSL